MIRKYKYMILSALVCCISLSGCREKNEPEPPNSNDEGYEQTMEYMINFDRYSEVMYNLYGITPADTIIFKTEPLYGEVLDGRAPDTYSVAVESEAAALGWFVKHCVPLEERDSINALNQDKITLDFGEFGKVSYSPVSGFATARIEISLKGAEKQKAIELVDKQRWPNNAGSLFYPGDVVYDKTYGKNFLCVRACEGGQRGVLINFSQKWSGEEDEYWCKYHSWWQDDFKTRLGASEDAWDGLVQLYYEDPENYNALIEDISKKVSGFREYQRHYKLDSSDPRSYYVGEPWGGKHKWWGTNCWKLYRMYIYDGKENIQLVNGMPQLRKETKKIADHDWYDIPGAYSLTRSVTFTNQKSEFDRFTRVYCAN